MGVFTWKFASVPFITVRLFWDTFWYRFIWFWMNLRNFNPRKITFLVGFWYKTIFPQSLSMTAYIQSDVEFYCASFGISEKFVASCPPMDTPTQKLKNEFSGRNSHGIYPNLEYFWTILKALQTLLFKIKIHPSA